MPPRLTRRTMLSLTSAASLATLASAAAAEPRTSHASTPRFSLFALTLQGPSTGNPFLEVTLSATFTLGHRSLSVEGFYDGAGTYRIRFMPDTEGPWTYTTTSNTPALAAHSGSFLCTPALPNEHGPVSVRNTHHFAHADGTPFFPFGTTSYAWIHQPEPLQLQTLASLKASPFNKIRMCVFPKHYEYNHNEPALYPFDRTPTGVNDYTRPNPAFFAHLERRIQDLAALNIQADLILFHPYDNWGYSSMPPEADDRYLHYLLARLSAFPNLWWSLANEFDLMHAKTTQDFDRLFHLVEQHDPYSHLRSIHYSVTLYDYAQPWVTHASLQTFDFDRVPAWLAAWHKPICFDEIQYEGNLNKRWGNISGEELTRRFWLATIAGCYATHGETFLDPTQPLDENTTPTLWWSHGGTLHGTSPARIAFLRTLVESTHTGLEAPDKPYYLNASTHEKIPQQILFYLDFHQPIYYEFPLPNAPYEAEFLDPWLMTSTPIPGLHRGLTKLQLPAKPGTALRFRLTAPL